MQNVVPKASWRLYHLPTASFSSYATLKSHFNSSMISRATSGKPSFLTNGNTAAFVGAKTAGSFKKVRVDPSSSVSSCNALEKTARNKRSKPTDVSTTYGT